MVLQLKYSYAFASVAALGGVAACSSSVRRRLYPKARTAIAPPIAARTPTSQVITTTWTEYRIPFDCFGDGTVFDGHLLSMLLEVRGDTFDVSIDNVGYYTE